MSDQISPKPQKNILTYIYTYKMWFTAFSLPESFYGWGSQSGGSEESHRQVM